MNNKPVKVLPMAQLLRLAREKEAQAHQPEPASEALALDPTHPNPYQPIPSHPIPKEQIGSEQQSPRINSPSTGSKPSEFAPNRDFNRRANSLERDALPKGIFPGTSKKLYDALYLRTRGAIVPTKTIQATKRQLMDWSGIKSKNTIAVNLHILNSQGIVITRIEVGDHLGSVYEILLPEEANYSTQPDPTQPNQTHPDPTQKLGGDPTQLLGWVGSGNLVENKDTYASPKTSFNTKEKEIDDEISSGFYAAFQTVTKELTGRELTIADKAKFNELAELLIAELRIAAARTESVSNVPAFLTEHLRRRLWKREKEDLQAEAEKPDTKTDTSQKLTKEQIKSCPDCGGSGFCYPNGYDGGVVKCRHDKLSRGDQ